MAWYGSTLLLIIALHSGSCTPTPLDELTKKWNLNASPYGPLISNDNHQEEVQLNQKYIEAGPHSGMSGNLGMQGGSMLATQSCFIDQRCHIGHRLPYKPTKKSRILDGGDVTSATIGPPWKDFIVSIKTDTLENDGKHKSCGGALISRRHVLTALHCLLVPKKRLRNRPIGKILVPPQNIEIFIKSLELWNGEAFKAGNIFFKDMPEIKFYQTTCGTTCDLKDDIALIKLDREIPEGQVKPISLPNSPLQPNVDEYWAAGWGATRTFPQWIFPNSLKFHNVLSSPCPRSQNLFPLTKYICFQQRNNGMVQGGISEGTCTGDSGSPGVTPIPFPDPDKEQEVANPWFLQGIVSRIIGGNGFCNDTTSIAAHMDVDYYKRDIENWMTL